MWVIWLTFHVATISSYCCWRNDSQKIIKSETYICSELIYRHHNKNHSNSYFASNPDHIHSDISHCWCQPTSFTVLSILFLLCGSAWYMMTAICMALIYRSSIKFIIIIHLYVFSEWIQQVYLCLWYKHMQYIMLQYFILISLSSI